MSPQIKQKEINENHENKFEMKNHENKLKLVVFAEMLMKYTRAPRALSSSAQLAIRFNLELAILDLVLDFSLDYLAFSF